MFKISNLVFCSLSLHCKIRTMAHMVFTYGTLKQDEPNHQWLTNPANGVGTFVSNGVTKQKYPLIIGTPYNVPFLLQSPGDGNFVEGEIYEVDDKMLGKLDILEEHPTFYERELAEIYKMDKSGTKSKDVLKCWVYFIKKFRPELLNKETFVNYSSKGSHGLQYIERSKRNPKYNPRQDIKG